MPHDRKEFGDQKRSRHNWGEVNAWQVGPVTQDLVEKVGVEA